MVRSKRGSVFVVEASGKLAGIFTERDLVKKVSSHGEGLKSIELHEVMTRHPEALKKHASIAKAIYLMASGGFRHIPITDSDGRPVGEVSVNEFIDHLYRRLGKGVLEAHGPITESSIVEEFFANEISVLKPSSALRLTSENTVEEAFHLLRSNNIGAVVIVDGRDHPIGIFSERDYIAKVALSPISMSHTPLLQKMTEHPCTVFGTTTVAMAFSQMSEGGFRHLPVVDEYETLTGILSVKNFIIHLSSGVLAELAESSKQR